MVAFQNFIIKRFKKVEIGLNMSKSKHHIGIAVNGIVSFFT
jgi:hypothetical protein